MRALVLMGLSILLGCGGEVVIDDEPLGVGGDPDEPTTDPTSDWPESCSCPEGLRQGTNGEGQLFCTTTPDAPPGAFAQCDELEDGWLGFGWPLAETPDYECPLGSEAMPDGDEGACFWWFDPATTVDEYCLYFEKDGYLGYLWDACAPGYAHDEDDDGNVVCTLEAALPLGAEADCDQLDGEALGFRWPVEEDPDYTCPAGATTAPDVDGWQRCLWPTTDAPEAAEARCEPDATVIAYGWSASC